jgi:hypothetical protein
VIFWVMAMNGEGEDRWCTKERSVCWLDVTKNIAMPSSYWPARVRL